MYYSKPRRTQLYLTHRSQRSGGECRENAYLAAQLADSAKDAHELDYYRQIENGWVALAEMQEWLDGAVPPIGEQRND